MPVESPEISGDVEDEAGQQTDSIPLVLHSAQLWRIEKNLVVTGAGLTMSTLSGGRL